MKLRYGLISLLTFFLLSWNIAQAGFGITPPYVRNDSLTQDSQYDQKIILTRSDPVEDLRANVTINVPGANDWFSIDKGTDFILPKGEVQVPMVVHVRVPKKAKFAEYKGNIRVVISSASEPNPGTVGISLGAQIDVNMKVIDQKIYDFFVRSQHVDDLEEGHKFFGIFFPGKINFSMLVENTGNVDFAPTRVELDIKDKGGNILETTHNVNRISKVKPFEIKSVVAELPTRLPAGGYTAHFRIYKFDQVVREGELNLSVLPYGTLQGYHGFYFFGLRRIDQIILVSVAVILLGLILSLVFLIRRVLRRRRGMRPPRYRG